MDSVQISELARMLIDAHGSQAIVVASQRQAEEERQGNNKEAENWRKVRSAIAERRGPHAS